MPELPRLTLTFLQRHPASAARAIEALAAEDAAELMRRVPARIATPVFGAMNSVAAARCVARLPVDSASAACAALPWVDASALMRQLEPEFREALLARLPTTTALRFRRSLDYAASAVGAWVEMDVPSITADRSVEEAQHVLSHSPGYSASHLLVTDAAQRYAGAVALTALMRAASSETVGALASRECRPLRDSASIATVATSGDWHLSSLLPVVNYRGELLGGLSLGGLKRARREFDAPITVPGDSLPAQLLDAYLAAAAGVLRLLAGTQDRTTEPQEPG